ncbi:MAG: hypothetical protein PHQ94_05700 [Syntrophomonas sp.]|nr:hypothetical protein [Syntrophomonas sp.]
MIEEFLLYLSVGDLVSYAQRVFLNTGSWVAAIYLALLKYAEDKSIEDIQHVTRLVKTAVFDKPPGWNQFNPTNDVIILE